MTTMIVSIGSSSDSLSDDVTDPVAKAIPVPVTRGDLPVSWGKYS